MRTEPKEQPAQQSESTPLSGIGTGIGSETGPAATEEMEETEEAEESRFGTGAAQANNSASQPHRARATAMSSERRREAILDAVCAEVVEREMDVTTKDLAALAGVAEGTLFRVFGSKEELLIAAFTRRMEQVAMDDSWRSRLDAVTRAAADVSSRRFDNPDGSNPSSDFDGGSTDSSDSAVLERSASDIVRPAGSDDADSANLDEQLAGYIDIVAEHISRWTHLLSVLHRFLRGTEAEKARTLRESTRPEMQRIKGLYMNALDSLAAACRNLLEPHRGELRCDIDQSVAFIQATATSLALGAQFHDFGLTSRQIADITLHGIVASAAAGARAD